MSRRKLGRTGVIIAGLFGMLAISAGSAVASGPPIVTIGATTNPTLNTRTINGTVDRNGSNTTYKVEYGKTKLYGNSTTSINLTPSGAIPVSVLLFGLEPLNTYHARISATNSFGTTVSEDVSFEQLLQWKVAGKPLSAWPERGGLYEDPDFTHFALAAEGTTKSGTGVKITCEDGTGTGAQAWGELGIFYRFPYKNCKTFLNGTESSACKPPNFTLELNGVLVPVAGSKFQLGLECSIGETISLTASGFELGAMSEAVTQNVTLTEHLQQFGMKVTLSGNEWEKAGETLGKTFGIS